MCSLWRKGVYNVQGKCKSACTIVLPIHSCVPVMKWGGKSDQAESGVMDAINLFGNQTDQSFVSNAADILGCASLVYCHHANHSGVERYLRGKTRSCNIFCVCV